MALVASAHASPGCLCGMQNLGCPVKPEKKNLDLSQFPSVRKIKLSHKRTLHTDIKQERERQHHFNIGSALLKFHSSKVGCMYMREKITFSLPF